MNKNPPKNGVNSVINTYTILRALRDEEGATITELAEIVELSPGAIHNHLSTLESVNMVKKRGKKYVIGPECLLFGAHVRNHAPVLQAAKGEIDSLAMETGEIGHIYIEENGRLFILHEIFGENAVSQNYHIKRREKAHDWLHCTASGKSILAEMDESRAEELIQQSSLTEQTENTITNPDELLRELEKIRERGYAYDREEHITGIRSVGTIVKHDDGSIAGSISLSGPTTRLQDEFFEEELPLKVKQVANISEVNLQTGDTFF
ncbi:IclR family transcriptional regulator [Halobellus rubicundus]|uniref:IclR family transcriptional regulator n=1 Tax=Halobellus rubicundus TaxID=2996466 RepID=A0ABD5MFW4_9EURY